MGCSVFDFNNDAIHTLPEMNRGRFLHSSVFIDKKWLYVLDGYTDKEKGFERLDVKACWAKEEARWHEMKLTHEDAISWDDRPFCLSGIAPNPFEGSILLFGGNEGNSLKVYEIVPK